MALSGHASILFVCRDNSGLSLLAEAVAMNAQIGSPGRLRAFSAAASGTAPVDIAALECLHAARIPADGLSSKPVELFGFSGAPRIDLVVSMVEEAHHALQRLPWHGLVRLKSWALDDVSRLTDTHQRRLAYRTLLPRLKAAIRALADEEPDLFARAAA